METIDRKRLKEMLRSDVAREKLRKVARYRGVWRARATFQGGMQEATMRTHEPAAAGHVPIVAGLLIAQGFLELGFGLFCLVFSMFMLGIPAEALAGHDRTILIVLFVGLGLPALACGVLRIVAGWFNWRYQRRILGITALGIGLLSMFTGYCAPTAIALAIYGLIVYVNESVAAAFEMGSRGRTKAEIQGAFPV
jgi:hypothetical protein